MLTMGVDTRKIEQKTPRARRKMGLGSVLVLLIAFLASAGVGYTVYQRVNAAPTQTVPDQVVPVTKGTISATVSATGNVVADHQAKLTFSTSGTIKQVNVALGDKVKAGQVLATLVTTTLENKLAIAKSNLHTAQIRLDALKAPANPGDVAAAQAGVVSAQASLTKAQGDLSKLQAGPTQDDITMAKADLAKKQAALQQAQAAYDKVSWRSDIGSRPEAVALQQATSDYQASLAAYNLKIAPPKPEDVATAKKNVESATSALASAQAKLNQLNAGAKQTDLDAAEEAVHSASLSVVQAQTDLNNASLVAPIAGTVAAVTMNVGEQTSGNSYITIVDPSSVRVDVTVGETDLSKVTLGKPARVGFDALPDTNLQGKVVAIAPNSTVQQGVVTYLVSIRLDTKGVYLPAGMTANVNIVVDQRDNVLLVPNRAVRVQGRNRVVDVLVDGKPETRPVTVGLSNDQMTEIANGLQEGDQVVIKTTTTVAPRVGGFGGPGGGMMVFPR